MPRWLLQLVQGLYTYGSHYGSYTYTESVVVHLRLRTGYGAIAPSPVVMYAKTTFYTYSVRTNTRLVFGLTLAAS